CCGRGLVATGSDGLCVCPSPYEGSPEGCPRSNAGSGLTPVEIAATVKATIGPALRRCVGDAGVGTGRIDIYLEIDRHGRVFFQRINQTTIPNERAQRCAVEAFRDAVFPEPRGGYVELVYPMEFGSAH